MSSNLEPSLGARLVGMARDLTGTPAHQENRRRLAAPWLVVVDPQVIFADPSSPWAAPRFGEAMHVIRAIAPRFGDRVIVTRWLPGQTRVGSWRAYFKRWEFADRPPTDPIFDLVPEAQNLTQLDTVDVPTFSKWGNTMRGLIGPTPRLVLTGCATECCVLSTALAAADSGAMVRVISDACAGASDENHAEALHLLSNFDPQIKVIKSAEL